VRVEKLTVWIEKNLPDGFTYQTVVQAQRSRFSDAPASLRMNADGTFDGSVTAVMPLFVTIGGCLIRLIGGHAVAFFENIAEQQARAIQQTAPGDDVRIKMSVTFQRKRLWKIDGKPPELSCEIEAKLIGV